LAEPLLVVRDPVAFAAIALGGRYLIGNRWAITYGILGVIGFVLALVVGHGNVLTALYGARIYILHFPLIFLFPLAFNGEEFWKLCQFLLLIAIPMTVLIAFQHFLPQSHWVNRGVGGIGSAGFGGALGRFRPPGTFSFITGVSMFFPICVSVLFAMFLGKGFRPPRWVWCVAVCLVIAIPLSISRTLVFSYILVVAFALAGGAIAPALLKRLFPAILTLAALSFLISQSPLYHNSIDAFKARWEGANRHEGGEFGAAGALWNRTGGWILRDLGRGMSGPIFGEGIGSGSSGGAQLLSGRRALFFGEGEWGIILFEMGPIFGMVFILVRLALAVQIGRIALLYSRVGKPALLPFAAMPCAWLLIGVTGQPTSLGFIVLSCGMALVAIKTVGCDDNGNAFSRNS